MADPRNPSRFVHQLLPVFGRGGAELLVIVLKASFRLAADRAEPHAAPLPIFATDQRLPNGATRYPGDVALTRAGTDVVCLGTAYAPRGAPVPSFDASLEVGPVSRRVRVFGRRLWRRDPHDRRRFGPTLRERVGDVHAAAGPLLFALASQGLVEGRTAMVVCSAPGGHQGAAVLGVGSRVGVVS